MFASCGEDGSVRIFDIKNLQQSSIIYERTDKNPLIRVEWDLNDLNLLAVISLEGKSVQLLDIRNANKPVGEMNHEGVVNGLAWNANKPGQICTVQDNKIA